MVGGRWDKEKRERRVDEIVHLIKARLHLASSSSHSSLSPHLLPFSPSLLSFPSPPSPIPFHLSLSPSLTRVKGRRSLVQAIILEHVQQRGLARIIQTQEHQLPRLVQEAYGEEMGEREV